MSETLPNFSRAEEAMEAAESFYARAAELCEDHAAEAQQERDREFLQHCAKAAHTLAGSLASHRERTTSIGPKTFLQYTPAERPPGDRELEALRTYGQQPEQAFQELRHASQHWSQIFAQMSESAASIEAQELHTGCQELIEAWNKELSTAFAQGQDV